MYTVFRFDYQNNYEMEQNRPTETWDELFGQLTNNTFKDNRLDLSCCFIGEDILKDVVNALVLNPNLEILDLSRNDHIQMEGWNAVL